MSHQPYENLLFSDQTLDEGQLRRLDMHLQECVQCASLAAALASLDAAFTNSPPPTPAPGFTQRWQTRLSVYRQQRQSRNLWLMTIGLFVLAGLTMLIIVLCHLNQLNWAYELSKWIASISLVVARVRQITIVFRSITNALPIIIPIFVLFATGTFFAISALIVTWFSSIVKLYFPIQERGN